MLQILAFIRKEFQLWAQKPGSWVIVFLVPLIFIWIVQSVFGSGAPVVTTYAVDEDQSTQSMRVMEVLRDSDNLNIQVLQTREDADQRVGSGQRLAAIVLPKGFGEALTTPEGAKVVIIVDPARSEQANIVTGLVNAALAPVIVDAEVSRSVENSVANALQILPTSTPVPGSNDAAGTETETQPDPLKKFLTAAIKGVVSSQVQEALDHPQVTVKDQTLDETQGTLLRRPSLLDSLVPGYSLMFVFFLIANLAVTVIEERETGTLRRLLVAPIPRSRILFGKIIPYFLIAVAQFVVVLLVSKWVFGFDLGNSGLALSIIIFASSLAMVTLGILIAAFARNESQANSLSIVLVLAMAVVSGAVFPSISIPGLKMITPHYWALQGFLNTVALGQGTEGVMLPAGILLTMSALFFTIGAVRFQFE